MIVLILYGFFIFLFLLGLLWVFVPALYGLPSRPTNPDRIRAALKLANLQPNEVLYDLGAGDGRVLLIAAQEFGARAVGIEIGPVQCALIWLRVTASGFGNKIQLKWGNFFTADLKDADVVFIYATSRQMPRLASHLANQLKIGARIVSISADFSEWEPSLFDEPNLIFIYEMPPKEGSLTTYLLKNTKM
ncbi:MAG: hypothetical protein MHPDNHAH_00988 [Anaerolineales bacterium]|nr:hypothetical protein [Anaerolineales bacterium]WKZ46377.1 MAG: class I SAM-dependent methyltransferase [Anaerolineales bacterium]